jgi:hypothetical protein
VGNYMPWTKDLTRGYISGPLHDGQVVKLISKESWARDSVKVNR